MINDDKNGLLWLSLNSYEIKQCYEKSVNKVIYLNSGRLPPERNARAATIYSITTFCIPHVFCYSA
jgi:hypothetical protein